MTSGHGTYLRFLTSGASTADCSKDWMKPVDKEAGTLETQALRVITTPFLLEVLAMDLIDCMGGRVPAEGMKQRSTP